MENNGKTQWRIRAAVAGIFLLGCLAGALAMNVYRGQFWRYPREPRGERFEQMLDRLNLTPDQRTQMDEIIKESRSQLMEIRRQSEPRYKEIRKLTDEKLTILSAQQWQQWQQMTREIRGRRKPGLWVSAITQ